MATKKAKKDITKFVVLGDGYIVSHHSTLKAAEAAALKFYSPFDDKIYVAKLVSEVIIGPASLSTIA